jgi:transcription elongation factor GreA
MKAFDAIRDLDGFLKKLETATAFDRQLLLQNRISFLEHRLRNTVYFDPDNTVKASAVFESLVLLENVDTGEEVTYQLVGSKNVNVNEGRISVRSPLGKAIIGKNIGDKISINAPGGKRRYELIDIW